MRKTCLQTRALLILGATKENMEPTKQIVPGMGAHGRCSHKHKDHTSKVGHHRAKTISSQFMKVIQAHQIHIKHVCTKNANIKTT